MNIFVARVYGTGDESITQCCRQLMEHKDVNVYHIDVGNYTNELMFADNFFYPFSYSLTVHGRV
jgi:hypothetical protein